MELFLTLVAVHFLCDFALQGDYMAINKSRHKFEQWYIVLTAHCFIHGLGVYLILRLYDFNNGIAISSMIFMVVSHFMIDYMKNDSKISYKTDQLLHLMVVLIIATAV